MILKKKRIIQLSIVKGSGWSIGEKSVLILNPTKVPLYRYPKKCNRICEFYGICSFWGSNYTLKGITVGNSSICDCDSDSKYSYIFTYENLRLNVPVDVLKEIGIYREPVPKRSTVFLDKPRPNYSYNKNQGRSWGGNTRYKNYNSRRK